jgi:hypothetical protein
MMEGFQSYSSREARRRVCEARFADLISYYLSMFEQDEDIECVNFILNVRTKDPAKSWAVSEVFYYRGDKAVANWLGPDGAQIVEAETREQVNERAV